MLPARLLLPGLLLAVALPAPTQKPETCTRRWTFPVPFYQSVAWSPDGSRLAFAAVTTSWEDGYGIFVVGRDGASPARLDTGGLPALFPAFSPDGSRLAFQGKRDGNSDVYVMPAAGGPMTRLTDLEASDGYPSWSPDGTRIAFHSDRDGDYEIWVMDADGSDPVRLTDHPADDYNPAWSPDGSRIAFDSDRDETEGDEIYVVAPDGSGLARVVEAGVFPAWSPDAREILYAEKGLYRVALDGSGLTRLLDNAVAGAWSPDGSTIAAAAIEFDAECRDRHSLVLLDPDGPLRRKLRP